MSKAKNQEILDNIYKTNFLGLNKEAIKTAMLKQEIAGMDKERSDGLVGNTIIECKLNDNEGGGYKRRIKNYITSYLID